jgi:hypothetical protein
MPSKAAVNSKVPYYRRKIKCPANYYLPPNVDVYVREEVPELKNVSAYAVKKYGVQKLRRKKDRWGRPILDWKKIYDLEKKGLAFQPVISASFAIEHIYDPMSQICVLCKGRCLEGKGGVATQTIKRLNGSYYRGPEEESRPKLII